MADIRVTEAAVNLAELVFDGVVGLKTKPLPEDADITILMHEDDIKMLNGSGVKSTLWNKRIEGAYWVKPGHPILEIQVPL